MAREISLGLANHSGGEPMLMMVGFTADSKEKVYFCILPDGGDGLATSHS